MDPNVEISETERDLGLPHGFFESLLLKDDDWSFVIKVHALVEAAVSHLLAEACGDPRLIEPFTRIELSNAATGKLAFAEALGCLDSPERGFIRKLSEVRNKFAHDVRNAGATLANYVAGLDPQQLRAFVAAVGPVDDPFILGGRAIPALDFTRDNPRLAIWLRALFLIAFAQANKRLAATQRDIAVHARQLLRSCSP